MSNVPACSNCGSATIQVVATAVWDIKTNEWKVEEIDNTNLADCSVCNYRVSWDLYSIKKRNELAEYYAEDLKWEG